MTNHRGRGKKTGKKRTCLKKKIIINKTAVATTTTENKTRREVDRPTGIYQIGRLYNHLPSQGENNLPAPLTCHRAILERKSTVIRLKKTLPF